MRASSHGTLCTTSFLLAQLQVQAKDNIKVLKEEISKLRAGELSNVGLALKNSFELLNMHRLDKNQDSFGLGRRPWVMEVCRRDSRTSLVNLSCLGPRALYVREEVRASIFVQRQWSLLRTLHICWKRELE